MVLVTRRQFVQPTVFAAGVLYFYRQEHEAAFDETSATVFNQGYIAINSPKQNGVLFPSVGVNASGKAVIAFSIAGEEFFPSSGYATLDAANGAGPIVISFNGVAPNDGFTAYRPVGPNFRVGRWGDYSWAVSDESGTIWMGAEVIPPEQAPFVPFANWGTFVTAAAPWYLRVCRGPSGGDSSQGFG